MPTSPEPRQWTAQELSDVSDRLNACGCIVCIEQYGQELVHAVYAWRIDPTLTTVRAEPSRTCSWCMNRLPESALLWLGPEGSRAYPTCESCFASGAIGICDHCQNPSYMSNMWTPPDRVGEQWCSVCRFESYTQCFRCSVWYADRIGHLCPEAERMTAVMDDDDDDDYDDDSPCRCGCNSRNNSDLIMDYGYRPDPIFHGNDRNRLYFGMELEVATGNSLDLDEAAHAFTEMFDKGDTSELFYLKSDSSINYGFEAVTHPMTFDFAMKSIDWSGFDDLANRSVIREDSSCGIHIHVSRAGFSGRAHQYRWLQFMHRNSGALTVMARRRSEGWAAWELEDRHASLAIVRGRHRASNRYRAINTIPRETFEVRIFAGAVESSVIQGSLATVAASVEYARQLTSHQVMHNAGYGWLQFLEWADDQEKFDPLLLEWMRLAPTSPVTANISERRAKRIKSKEGNVNVPA